MTLVKNVNVFDRKSETMQEGHDVLMVRNPIQQIGEETLRQPTLKRGPRPEASTG